VIDKAAVLESVCQALCREDAAAASDLIRSGYPFLPLTREGRRYTESQSVRVFTTDGFIDRYSGKRLVFPGVLRLLSQLLPLEFPFHPNWKMSETHPAYWELFPTIDHVVPITRGGVDSEANWVTTSMLMNGAKANWTLTELGWSLHAPGSLAEWDGLMGWFLKFIDSKKTVLEDAYLRRWHRAAVNIDREFKPAS
jgi:hypothetical protein